MITTNAAIGNGMAAVRRSMLAGLLNRMAERQARVRAAQLDRALWTEQARHEDSSLDGLPRDASSPISAIAVRVRLG